MSSHPHRRHDDNVQYAHSIDGGKKTAKLEGRCTDALKEAFRRKCMDAGFASESECLEKLAAIFAYGAEHVRMMEERKIQRVCFMSDIARTDGGYPGICP